MAADAVISARDLGRRYGDKRVLVGVDLEVERGELLLVTGPNGSGKTTLLRLLAGLIVPTSGALEVRTDRARIGFLAHEPLLYRELTPLENLDLYGRLYRISERRERIGMLLERYGLWDARHERVDALSRGMMQRLALCRTLLHEPELLLFDEPFTALDAGGVELLLAELADGERTRTAVVSSHQPERLGDRPTARLALCAA
jgi:ABC-type multidrug transport system ATPase subunit